jgi:2-polyprenyl-3-methyl-5-hydroxy-6-metoxy-1,4-benzoquinol methylase
MGKVESGGYYDIISDPVKRLAHEGEFLLWLLEKAPGPRALDMACGTGVQALFLAGHGARLTARDIDEDMISYARSIRPHDRITYEVADMRAGLLTW